MSNRTIIMLEIKDARIRRDKVKNVIKILGLDGEK